MKLDWVAETGVEDPRWHAYCPAGDWVGHVRFIPDEGLGEWWLVAGLGQTMRAHTLDEAKEMLQKVWEEDR